MAVDGYVQVPPDSTGAKIDAASVGVAGNTVMRQRIVIGDNSASAQFALVTGGALLVQPNAVAISGTPSFVLAAGTANFGTLNNISRTVDVTMATQPPVAISGTATIVISNFLAGSGQSVNLVDTANTALRVNVVSGSGSGANPVSIAAGTSNIGFINNISATVNVAITGWLDSSGNSKAIVDSANTALRVNIVAGAAAGVSQIDDTSFSTGAATFAPIGAVFSDSGTGLSLSASHAGALRMTGFRAMHVNIRNSAGVETGTPTSPFSVKVEQISATASVVLAAGTANIGTVQAISATVNIAGIVQINSAAAPVIVNNISATVNVAAFIAGYRDLTGATVTVVDATFAALRVLGAGTNGSFNIGQFNDASGTGKNLVDSSNLALRVTIANATATVAVTCATPFTINNISRTVAIVCSTPFTIDNISATVVVTTANPYVINVPSASHGPVMVQRSTSATATFIAAPGAGLHIYVTQLAVSNAGTNLTGCQIGTSASLGAITMVAAANGGGFVMNFDPPFKCYSNEALLCRCDPAPGGNCFFNVNFFVAA